MIEIKHRMFPLVSIIITSYNHANYLERAVKSALDQTYDNVEIVVIDDGSTDQTRELIGDNKFVRYVHQINQGLSSARNKGISESKGELLVFLDADDWLAPEALMLNYHLIQTNENLAMVSGGHQKVSTAGELDKEYVEKVSSHHYEVFLQKNYIGMHAAVMYRRWAFDEFKFDSELRACEDYDIYLNVSRKFEVAHHNSLVAFYFFHDANMSSNIELMLTSALTVLHRQRPQLRNEQEHECYKRGIENWTEYYLKIMQLNLESISITQLFRTKSDFRVLKQTKPLLYRQMVKAKWTNALNRRLSILNKEKITSASKRINYGDLNRLAPLSTEFGYDRGGPIDRYYIENFLFQNRNLIHGRVLEIGDNTYTLKYGQKQNLQSEVLHINTLNPNATIIGDLSDLPNVPDNSFSCIILTQTLHLIFDYNKAIETCYRILKPGGILLITVPGISHIDHGEWKYTWLWTFTDVALKRVLELKFRSDKISVSSFGNVFVASAFLYGLGLSDVNYDQLNHSDPHYQLINVAVAEK